MVTHNKACAAIRKDPVLQMVVYRKGVEGHLYDSKPMQQPIMYQGYDQTNHNNSFIAAPNSSFATPDKYD